MPQFESEFEQELYRQRQGKLEQIQQIGERLGLSPLESIYPNRFPVADETLTLAQIPDLLDRYDNPAAPVSAEQLEQQHVEIAVAGRLMSLRLQGKAGFAHLQGGGKRLQIYVRKDDVGEDAFALYKLLDLGDHIGVRGHLMRTRTGELTLKATPVVAPDDKPRPAISFLAKAMLALPDKYHGLEDVELRYRQRYVDLIMNSGTLAKAEPPINTAPTAITPTKAEPASNTPQTAIILSEAKDLGISPGAPPKPNADAFIPPGTAPVTPNEEHDDAPLNVREVFVKRAAILRAIRKFLDARGYLEVETPMLHTVAGGAAARPFSTHHNALDIPLSLRIAPELFLKRLVVGGLDRVYEINRNFRNEGVSTRHNPEFTMLEFYQAYANYKDLMKMTQQLFRFIAEEISNQREGDLANPVVDIVIPAGKRMGEVERIDFSQPWREWTMIEAIQQAWPPAAPLRPTKAHFSSGESFKAFLSAAAQLHNVEPQPREQREHWAICAYINSRIDDGLPWGTGVALLFELTSEELLIQPTIIYDFPLSVSPLSKVKPDEPDWVERFEFYIGGFEVGNAFSELNDAADQERRFQAQVADKDPESMAAVDEDYVRALGYGLPPTAGEGIGIDRLTMLLTGSRSIRDVILFPLMRPRAESAGTSEEAKPGGQAEG